MRAPLTLPGTGVLSVILAVGLLFWAQGGPAAVPPTEVVVGEGPTDEPTPVPSPDGDVVAPPPPITDEDDEDDDDD